MKTKFTILISILMLIFFLPKDIQAQTATQPLGDGTAEQPYRVSTLDNLYWITQNSTSWDKHFIQIADIDATSTSGWDGGSGFTPIGNSTTQFTGTYDGQGYTIDALYINRASTSSLAFIGYIDDASAEVENLGITNCDITGNYRTGAIVGYLIDGSVNKCYSTGTVNGRGLVGGLVGFNSAATITNSYSKANVTRTSGTNSFIGAFVGTVTSGTIENCYATGDVSYDGATNPTDKGFSGGSSGGTFNNNFFDSEVSNQTSATGATAKTTTEMQNISTYTDKATTGLTNAWDFIETPYNDYSETDIWGMNMNSYPHLLTGNKEPEGDGSIYSPYKITNLQNLLWLTQNTDVWINKYFEQTANIDAYATISWDNGAGFSPIGNSTTSFSGFYKGKNHAINNLYINRPSNNNVAFIGIISGASTRITNLGITNCNITGNQITAGLIGTYVNNLSASAILRNCYTSGTITGNSDYTAGLIARIYDDEIEVYNCYSNCDVTGTSYVAGLVGYYYGDSNQDNIISCSYSTGTITGSSTNVGGLIGYAYYIETSNCYSKANIVNTASSSSRNGAFVGQSSYSTIEYSYATGSVSNAGTNPTANGFVGNYSSSTFTNNFFDSEASNQTSGTGATGLTTAQMKNQFSLTNWDFVNETTNGTNDYWQIDATVNDGYPSLAIPSGSGTSSAPYVIATLSDLKWLSGNSSSWDKDFIQVADIDASTIASFSPIGSSTTNFTGTYDGQNYKINGLNVGYGTNQGLFGYVGENAELKNIIVENATVGSANNENTGILIGRINEGTVTNCHTSGTVLGRIYTGGLIGYALNSDIIKSSSSASVTTGYQYGG